MLERFDTAKVMGGHRGDATDTIAVGTRITPRPPGHGRRSPAPRSHRTRRADFPHRALRQLIHSTANACSSRYGRRSLGCGRKSLASFVIRSHEKLSF